MTGAPASHGACTSSLLSPASPLAGSGNDPSPLEAIKSDEIYAFSRLFGKYIESLSKSCFGFGSLGEILIRYLSFFWHGGYPVVKASQDGHMPGN